MTRIACVFSIAISLTLGACKNNHNQNRIEKRTAITDCGCDSIWSRPVTKEFVTFLEKTTTSDHPVWKDYSLGDGTFVLNAGRVNDTSHCLGLWKSGKAISFTCSPDIPRMLTPIYSYYLNYKDPIRRDSTFFETSKNAPKFLAWMKSNAVELAVYMPTDFPKFPFRIGAKTKTQLAIHESFHIEVMLRYWYTKKGYWPEWDMQPDRAKMQICYAQNGTIKKLIETEQNLLSLLIEALLDHKKEEAFGLADEFMKTRKTRYRIIVDLNLQLDEAYNCAAAEAIMEIEEGIADYASWVKMYDVGLVSRADILRRYRAQQKDKFYLTGCMLFHAMVLMNNGNDEAIIERMTQANSLEEGSLLTLFQEYLTLYRKNQL
ncbi:hypothetical protein [Spongiimicrobium salis]|uniref:hypothetical protein n=1 Tax=Spongiimicrobium salis TaxID=1667022 RepID=UPI00374DC68A